MSSYVVRIGEQMVGETTDAATAAGLLAEAREMQRWASHYGEALSLKVDGRPVDATNHYELDAVGLTEE